MRPFHNAPRFSVFSEIQMIGYESTSRLTAESRAGFTNGFNWRLGMEF